MTERKCERVVLVGFMGAGKSTVGREVAAKLGWRFLDLDSEIETEAGAAISEIFDRFGESHFRRLESDVGQRALSLHHVVVATGGGWAVDTDGCTVEDVTAHVLGIVAEYESEEDTE